MDHKVSVDTNGFVNPANHRGRGHNVTAYFDNKEFSNFFIDNFFTDLPVLDIFRLLSYHQLKYENWV